MPYRYSGHETFPCRYAWLPKGYRLLNSHPVAFGRDDQAMVELGLGKNMVRALRFWVQAIGVADWCRQTGYTLTPFGHALLADDGHDPFLEDRRTLWLLHWRLATHSDEPLFAWDYLLNRWHRPDMSRSAVLEAFLAETSNLARPLSSVTLEQHLDVFLHTYLPTSGPKGAVLEDNLDCPLVELNLVHVTGERSAAGSGHREPIYAFRRDTKPDVTPALFAYCLDTYWSARRAGEETLGFRDIAVGAGSPGRVFQLSEWDVRDRLLTIERDTRGAFRYEDSATHPRVVRGGGPAPSLARIYEREGRA